MLERLDGEGTGECCNCNCNYNETLQQLTISDSKKEKKEKTGITKANVVDSKTPTSGITGANELSIRRYIIIFILIVYKW